jgi:multidrug efflux pump subunit AcrB
VRVVVQRRLVTIAASAALFLIICGLVVGGRVPFVLFPKGESNLLRARVRFPEGTPATVSEAAVRQLERAAQDINKDDDAPVRQVFSNVGEWAGFWTETGAHLCEVTVELTPSEQRRRSGAEILDTWRAATGTVHDATTVEMVQFELGPTEKPLEVRLRGRDIEQLGAAADKLTARLATYAGTREIDTDLIPGKLEMQISLKPIARTLGLAEADLATQLREGFHGGEAVRVLRQGEEVKVQVRYPRDERGTLADVGRMRVRTPGGEEIPFSEAASVRTVRGYSAIWRQDGLRRVRVRADVDERRANAEQILRDLTASFLPEMEQRHRKEKPFADFSISLGGQRARMRESLSSLLRGLVLAVIAIYAILASMLKSYLQPAIITLAIPLGMIGAVLGHQIMGYDLTIMSAFGAVALSGVVVNDALVLIVRINREVRAGRPVFEAVVAAGESRFRAVILTTVTTVAGLMPLLLERATQAQQLIPMVISLSFGLIFATLLTLLAVPALYMAVNDFRRVIRWLHRGGDYPTPESVEELTSDEMPAMA